MVVEDDDEAFELWQQVAGVKPDRIVRLGEKDNFWSMGDTGPCGPCSEILIDQGAEIGCGKPGCAVGCDCDRYLEIWNLVFMQYNRFGPTQLEPLPATHVDTGMGFERICQILQAGCVCALALSSYSGWQSKELILAVMVVMGAALFWAAGRFDW